MPFLRGPSFVSAQGPTNLEEAWPPEPPWTEGSVGLYLVCFCPQWACPCPACSVWKWPTGIAKPSFTFSVSLDSGCVLEKSCERVELKREERDLMFDLGWFLLFVTVEKRTCLWRCLQCRGCSSVLLIQYLCMLVLHFYAVAWHLLTYTVGVMYSYDKKTKTSKFFKLFFFNLIFFFLQGKVCFTK